MSREMGARVERENWQSGTIADIFRDPGVPWEGGHFVVSFRSQSGEPLLATLQFTTGQARQAAKNAHDILKRGMKVEWILDETETMINFEGNLYLRVKDFRIASGS